LLLTIMAYESESSNVFCFWSLTREEKELLEQK